MKNNQSGSILVGVLLILFGVLWLLANFIPGFNLNWDLIWPIFLFLPGLLLWGKYLQTDSKDDNWGILIPANILLFLSLTFFFNSWVEQTLNYSNIWALTAFMYPGSIAIAFWITWFASRKNPGIAIPAVILTAISILVFLFTTGTLIFFSSFGENFRVVFWPFLIICIGILIISGPFFSLIFKDNKKVMGKSPKEWEEWGESFGQNMENLGKSIGDSVEKTFNKDKAEEAKVISSVELKDAEEQK